METASPVQWHDQKINQHRVLFNSLLPCLLADRNEAMEDYSLYFFASWQTRHVVNQRLRQHMLLGILNYCALRNQNSARYKSQLQQQGSSITNTKGHRGGTQGLGMLVESNLLQEPKPVWNHHG